MAWTQLKQAQENQSTSHIKISSAVVKSLSAQLKPPLTHLI